MTENAVSVLRDTTSLPIAQPKEGIAEPAVNPYAETGAVWCTTCGYFTLPINNGKCGFCDSWIVLKSPDEMESDDLTKTIPATA